MNIWLWVVVTIFGVFSKGILSEYSDQNKYNVYPHSNSVTSERTYGYPYNYHLLDKEKYPAPVSKTEYGLHTVQTGTAYITPGQNSANHIVPESKKTQHYFVTTNTTTFYVPGKAFRRTSSNHTSASGSHRRSQNHRQRGPVNCIRCPSEKILIARKGLDGVLIEPPKLLSCQNRVVSSEVFQLETLFGSTFKFLLPHGSHYFHGKIKNKRTGKYLQTCIMRYKVVVQQCGRYFPRDENLKISCDPGYIWGSKCRFTCRTGYLSHQQPIICGDSLSWEGDEPKCLPHQSKRSGNCDFLMIPDHGKFACEYPKGPRHEQYENELTLPEGSICRVICDHNYEIPPYLKNYGVLHCESGRWNVTATSLCQPKISYNY